MPIYAYRCEGCGFQKDALQKLSDPPLVDCPACGAPRFVKQLTAAGFALKGTGWYVTDFRNGSKPSTGTASAGGASEGAAGASAPSASTGADSGNAAPAAATPSAPTASGSA